MMAILDKVADRKALNNTLQLHRLLRCQDQDFDQDFWGDLELCNFLSLWRRVRPWHSVCSCVVPSSTRSERQNDSFVANIIQTKLEEKDRQMFAMLQPTTSIYSLLVVKFFKEQEWPDITFLPDSDTRLGRQPHYKRFSPFTTSRFETRHSELVSVTMEPTAPSITKEQRTIDPYAITDKELHDLSLSQLSKYLPNTIQTRPTISIYLRWLEVSHSLLPHAAS